MVNLLYIAALIAALSNVRSVVYLVMTLKATERTLDNVADTMESLEKQMQGIMSETTELLHKTNELANDINQKSATINGLVDGETGIGETVKEFKQSLNEVSTTITKTASQNQDKVSQALKWGTAVMDIWKKRKS